MISAFTAGSTTSGTSASPAANASARSRSSSRVDDSGADKQRFQRGLPALVVPRVEVVDGVVLFEFVAELVQVERAPGEAGEEHRLYDALPVVLEGAGVVWLVGREVAETVHPADVVNAVHASG
jgi:hypothetical protein